MSCLCLCDLRDYRPQAPLSMRFPRQGFWNVLPFPSAGDLPDSGMEPMSPPLPADSSLLSHQGNPLDRPMWLFIYLCFKPWFKAGRPPKSILKPFPLWYKPLQWIPHKSLCWILQESSKQIFAGVLDVKIQNASSSIAVWRRLRHSGKHK